MKQRSFAGGEMRVSRLGLGTSTWGIATEEADCARQFAMFSEAGGTLIETANVYGNGESERIIGRLLGKHGRDRFVVATKAGLVPGKPPLRTDAWKQRLLSELTKSLRNLGVDHVDLWQIHTWDYDVAVEETLAAIDEAIDSGTVRAAGVCNYAGWQTAKAATLQQLSGHPLTTVEVEYSLVQRGIEREVVPATEEFGISILPWGPLGRGVLSGKYLDGIPAERADSRFFRWYVRRYATDPRCVAIATEVAAVARELGVPSVAVALAWVRDRPGVAAPIVGARTADQLPASLASESLELPAELRERLDDISAIPIGYPEHRAR